MKCNLKSFKVRQYIGQDGRTILDMRIAFDDEELFVMLHCKQHIQEFLLGLRGHTPYMTGHVFNDGLRYLESYPTGIRFLIHKSGMTNNEYRKDDTTLTGYKYVPVQEPMGFVQRTLYVPGKILTDKIDETNLSYKVKDLSKGLTAEITEAEAKHIRYDHREKVKVVFVRPEAEERFRAVLRSPHRKEIQDCLAGCLRIGRNHSMGNQVSLTINTDGSESFYWMLLDQEHKTKAGGQVMWMNGGWIKHEQGFRTHT